MSCALTLRSGWRHPRSRVRHRAGRPPSAPLDGRRLGRSSWEDAADALQEIGQPQQPLGPEFLALADRFDAWESPDALTARAIFTCSVCGGQVGAVDVRSSEGLTRIRRASFTSVLTREIDAPGLPRLHAAVAAGDAAAVFAVDPELAPFYCPECDASYCGDHWERWDVFDEELPAWHESIRGRCPRGHERMLED